MTGAVAGALDIIPMIAQNSRSALPVGLPPIFFAGPIVFYSNLPYLPWWADGMAVTLMMALPVVLILTGKDRKAAPVILLNALLLGFLISVAERYLA